MRLVHIEKKPDDTPRAAATLRAVLLREKRFSVTAADAAAISGLPLAQCEAALLQLHAQYAGRLQVHETGAMRFTFETLTRARSSEGGPFRRLTALLGRYRYVGYVLVATLGVPGLLLAVLGNLDLIMQVTANLPAGWSPERGEFFRVVATILWAVLALPAFVLVAPWMIIALPVVVLVQMLGLVAQEGPTVAAIVVLLIAGVGGGLVFNHLFLKGLFAPDDWAPRFCRLLGELVLGPATDPLEDERRLLALIARQEGVITVLDLIALFGWTKEQAEGQAIRVMLDYGGDLLITDDGDLIYRFGPMLLRAAAGDLPVDTRPVYEREATRLSREAKLGRGLGVFVASTAAFSLFGPMMVLAAPSVTLKSTPADMIPVPMRLALFAFVFGPPLLRGVGWCLTAPWRLRRRGLLRVVQAAVEHPGGSFSGRISTRAVVALGGEIDVERTNERGEIWVSFPRFEGLGAIAREARGDMARFSKLGTVSYDTGA